MMEKPLNGPVTQITEVMTGVVIVMLAFFMNMNARVYTRDDSGRSIKRGNKATTFLFHQKY